MAHIELEPNRLSVHLNPLDEILALHGSLHIPYSHIRSVYYNLVPPSWWSFEAEAHLGTDIPTVKVAGSFYNGDGVVFYDFHDPSRCLTLELDHETYRRVVVQVDKDQDPKELMNRIFERIPHKQAGGD